MADEKGRLEKIAKLLETLEELEEKAGAVRRELAALASNKPGIGVRLKWLREAFGAVWSTRYRGVYSWNHGKDDALAKKLLGRLEGEEIAARALRFLEDGDPFLVKNGHTFGMFYSSINRYAGETNGSGGDLSLESDADKTARDIRRMRGE